MVNRPFNGKASKWFRSVKLNEVTNTLGVNCQWFTPSPSEGENIFTASKYILENTWQLKSDSIDEFKATNIICVPILTWNEEEKCHVISPDSKKYILQYLDKVIFNINEGILEIPTRDDGGRVCIIVTYNKNIP